VTNATNSVLPDGPGIIRYRRRHDDFCLARRPSPGAWSMTGRACWQPGRQGHARREVNAIRGAARMVILGLLPPWPRRRDRRRGRLWKVGSMGRFQAQTGTPLGLRPSAAVDVAVAIGAQAVRTTGPCRERGRRGPANWQPSRPAEARSLGLVLKAACFRAPQLHSAPHLGCRRWPDASTTIADLDTTPLATANCRASRLKRDRARQSWRLRTASVSSFRRPEACPSSRSHWYGLRHGEGRRRGADMGSGTTHARLAVPGGPPARSG